VLGDLGNSGRLLVVETHLDSEGSVGLPLGWGTRGGLLHHLVDLLQSKTLGLGDEEVGVDKGASAKRSPDEENLGTQVALVGINHVRGDDSDDAVPEPVGGSGKGNTTGTDWQREDLTNHNPGTRSPCAGEEEDVDADEGDHSRDSLVVFSISDSDNGDQELADNHAQSTPQKQGTTTNLLNGVEGDRGRADIDNGGDHGDEEGVLDRAKLGEEGSTEVEDEVDTSPLLHHLERGTKNSTTDIAVGMEDVSTEAVEPAVEVTILRNNLHLIEEVGFDLVDLSLDVLRVLGLATDTSKRMNGLFLLALADVETRGFRKDEKTNSEDNSPKHLESDGNAVGARVGTVLSAIVNTRGKHETDSDAELVTGHDSTTNLARSNLGHVHDDNSRHESDTESSNQTASDQETEASWSSLEHDTDDEDNAASNNGEPTTKPICQITSDEGTEESTSRENRDDERLARGGNDELVTWGRCFVL